MSAFPKLKWTIIGFLLSFALVFLCWKWSRDPEKYFQINTQEIEKITKQYINNHVEKADSLDRLLFTDSYIEKIHHYDSLKKARFGCILPAETWIDSASILSVSFSSKESAKAFVTWFGADTQITRVDFLRKDGKWKINSGSYIGFLSIPDTSEILKIQ